MRRTRVDDIIEDWRAEFRSHPMEISQGIQSYPILRRQNCCFSFSPPGLVFPWNTVLLQSLLCRCILPSPKITTCFCFWRQSIRDNCRPDSRGGRRRVGRDRKVVGFVLYTAGANRSNEQQGPGVLSMTAMRRTQRKRSLVSRQKLSPGICWLLQSCTVSCSWLQLEMLKGHFVDKAKTMESAGQMAGCSRRLLTLNFKIKSAYPCEFSLSRNKGTIGS